MFRSGPCANWTEMKRVRRREDGDEEGEGKEGLQPFVFVPDVQSALLADVTW